MKPKCTVITRYPKIAKSIFIETDALDLAMSGSRRQLKVRLLEQNSFFFFILKTLPLHLVYQTGKQKTDYGKNTEFG